MSDWPAVWITALSDIIAMGWSANMAAGELSERFNRRFTRSAVIGKAKRAGIKLTAGHGGRRGPKGGPSQRKPRPRATSAQRPDTAIRKAASAPKLGAVSFVPRPDPRPGAVPLLELVPDGCRYPNGDSVPYFFCNQPTSEGSYCAGHAAICFRAPEPRRRQ